MLVEVSHRAGSLLRRILSLCLIVVVAAGATACGDDDPSGPGESIRGTWVLDTGGEPLYFEITSTTITVYEDIGPCVITEEYEIIDQDGDVYTLRHIESGFEEEVEIRRDDDTLFFDDDPLEQSNVDVDDFEVCSVPEAPSCASVPEIQFGFSELGDLEAGDPVDDIGAFYDWYSIVIDDTQPDPAVLAVDSEDFDTYLIVYDEAGNEIARNDDYDDMSTNARLDLSEPDGCYLVLVTSYGAGETGAYEVLFF